MSSPVVYKKARFLLYKCKEEFSVRRSELYIDKEDKEKWTVVLMDGRKKILPFSKRFKIAIKNLFIYNKLAKICPHVNLSIAFVPPKDGKTALFGE